MTVSGLLASAMKRSWVVLVLVISFDILDAWRTSLEERKQAQELRRLHSHSKRHMLPMEADNKKKSVSITNRDIRKKPSGHLTPLQEDDMDNDEVVSVAIGPPPIRPKYEKMSWKHQQRPIVNQTTSLNSGATTLVKDILTQLGREFLSHQVNEDFVFGQYVGISMKNLTSDLRLKMQHEILDVVVKYQMLSRGEQPKSPKSEDEKPSLGISATKESKDQKTDKKLANDTEEGWPDFSNLAKIVG